MDDNFCIDALKEKYTYNSDYGVSQKDLIIRLFSVPGIELTSKEVSKITNINRSSVTARISELLNKNLLIKNNFNTYIFNTPTDKVVKSLKSSFELLLNAIQNACLYEEKQAIMEEYDRLKEYQNKK